MRPDFLNLIRSQYKSPVQRLLCGPLSLRRYETTSMWSQIRKIFAPTESKSFRVPPLFALEYGGRARWTSRDYMALAREGYARNAIVYRAVRMIAESIGSLYFVLYDGAAERDTHPLLDLLRRPNPRQDGASFLEAVASHLLLAGNAYVEAVALAGEGGGNPQVRELYA